MAFLNEVRLIGRLTENPQPIRSLANGTSVISFRFAVGRSKKNAQGVWENDKNPLFIDCEAFSTSGSKRNLPDIISKHCNQGDQLLVAGRLCLDQWESKEGQKRSKHKLIVDNIEFLGGGKQSGESNGQARQYATAGAGAADDNDELIPF